MQLILCFDTAFRVVRYFAKITPDRDLVFVAILRLRGIAFALAKRIPGLITSRAIGLILIMSRGADFIIDSLINTYGSNKEQKKRERAEMFQRRRVKDERINVLAYERIAQTEQIK